MASESKIKTQQLCRLARQIAQQLPENKHEAKIVLEYVTKLVAMEHGDAAITPRSGLSVVAR